MQEAGFNVVRLAEFAWVDFEPAEGHFQFDWLDKALSILHQHGISAILGTPTGLAGTIDAGTGVSYTWDFGDGTPGGAAAAVTHTFAAAGTYTATVTAINNVGSATATTCSPLVSRACVRNIVPNFPAPIRPTVTGRPDASRSRRRVERFIHRRYDKAQPRVPHAVQREAMHRRCRTQLF